MRPVLEIEARLDDIVVGVGAPCSAGELLRAGEAILEHWVSAKSLVPTAASHEGFRLLALHRQGAHDDPSFNACRETCRELVFHYNLLAAQRDEPEKAKSTLQMMALVANHLVLFVGGKMQEAGLGDFCCASKPLREESKDLAETDNA